MLKQQREESDPSRLGPSCQPAAQDSPTAEQVPEKPPPPSALGFVSRSLEPPRFTLDAGASGCFCFILYCGQSRVRPACLRGGLFALSNKNCLISAI